MTGWRRVSRRKFVQGGALIAAAAAASRQLHSLAPTPGFLAEFSYGDVSLASGLPEAQLNQTHAVLMGLDDDALLKPFRQMAGKPAPGADLGGWYCYRDDYGLKGSEAGFAPAGTFGQWISALARSYAITKSPEVREKVLRLNRLYTDAISSDYFEKTRFPAYSYDKLVLGLIDSHQFVGDTDAFGILDHTTSLATPNLPPKAITREKAWRKGKDVSYNWDESYTLPENLFLAYQRGAGSQYRELAQRYLEDETYFDLLASGEDPLPGRHAYSYVNALSSAMQAYLTTGSEKHLRAAKHGFDLLTAQSFATGGWGPDELLSAPETDALFASLTKTHSSFETPCGAYAHFKLTRYLLRVTRDAAYGDSMERVMYNTVLGAKPMEDDGRAFYYADYNFQGKRVYSNHIWPCCSGTLPQIAADYRISAYLRDGRDVYVNLYLPSTLRWTSDGKTVSLTQQGNYPFEESIRMKLTMSHAASFALFLRIPGWAHGASVAINGKQSSSAATPGTFLRLEREWKSGDEITLTLPLTTRLEAISQRHPSTVALLSGPVVLFPLGEGMPRLTRKQALSARQVAPSQWTVETAGSTVRFASFTEINDDRYSTYFEVEAT
jgi:uncharacterized protein